ncbi:MAG: SRPBCC family protein [Chthoniobacterales bacterium]
MISLGELQRQIVETAALPLNQAKTLPAPAYVSEKFFAWEADHVLRQEWQCVAHISQIPAPGDFLNLELLGDPLIVVHGKDGVVRTLSRVCPHRSMDIMPEGFGYDGHTLTEVREGKPDCGHTRLFLCPYHAWTFELDGHLKACPEMQQAEGFSRDDFSLMPFRCETWNGFIFVNLSGDAAPLHTDLTEITADLAAFNLAEMKVGIALDWDCPFNWKVLVENFMESYHHLGIHHKTLQPLMPARDTWTEQERRRYIRAHLPYKESMRADLQEIAASLPHLRGLNEAQRNQWGLFLIYPTFLLATAHDRVIWYRLQPLGANRLKLLTTTLFSAEALQREDYLTLREQAVESLTTFHMEDMEVCTGVQRGLASSGWQQGRLSHLEMTVWLFYRYLAARIRGVWPTDDHEPAPSQRP